MVLNGFELLHGFVTKGRLSDIFDPDSGGTIGVMDIAAGIRRRPNAEGCDNLNSAARAH